MRWTRGVDTELFRPRRAPTSLDAAAADLPLSSGRVAVEKNIEAFLALDLPGTKVVVGDGPARPSLAAPLSGRAFPRAPRPARRSPRIYASADVFVFPSLTDTFGIVLLEALACGLPVAAFPVTGPLDVIGGTGAGVLDDDLRAAAWPPSTSRASAAGPSPALHLGRERAPVLRQHRAAYGAHAQGADVRLPAAAEAALLGLWGDGRPPRDAKGRRPVSPCDLPLPPFDPARAAEYPAVIGCDEVGRGALCGPVVVAAVWFDPRGSADLLARLDDSKRLDQPRARR